MISIRVVSALALSLTGLCGLPLAAQTLSAADILAKVEEKVGGVNEYQALLNDLDPTRSMAAMEVMLESGDADLLRLALDFGLYSPNPVVQRMALEGFFSGAPRLSVFFSGDEAQKHGNFPTTIANLGGSIDSTGQGFTGMLMGGFDQEAKCYTIANYNKDCLISVSDTGVTIFIDDIQTALKLNDSGELVGEGRLPSIDIPVSIRIPVAN